MIDRIVNIIPLFLSKLQENGNCFIKIMTPSEINEILDIPEQDKYTPIKTMEAEFIYNFLVKNKIKNTLETGFAYARSASHIIAATLSNHIVIDPFQSNYNNMGVTNLKNLGLDKYVTFYNDFSHNVLPELGKKGNKFEFIFIDGDHKFDGILVDFYYADLLLEKNGYVLLHDTWMRTTQLVMSFIEKSRSDYRKVKVPLRNFALYQKTGEDDRNGMHFKEFYTTRSLLSHNIIYWLNDGRSNFFKKIIFRLKEWLK